MHRSARTYGGRLRPLAGGARRCLAALLLSCVAAWSHGLDPDKALHHYVVHEWKLDAGLPQVQVTAVTQGPDGYMWVGTRGGLARFDGVRFRTFVPEDTPGLQGMIVRALQTDRRGRLWIGTYKGVTVFEDGEFRALDLLDESDGAPVAVDVRDFAERPDGEMIVATDRGLLVSNGDRLVRWRTADTPFHAVLALDNDVWVGEVGRVRRFGHEVTEHPLPEDRGRAVVDSLVVYHGTLWAGSSRGLVRWTGNGWVGVPLPAPLGLGPVEALYVDRDDLLWVATGEGLVRLRGNEPVAGVQDRTLHPGVQAMAEDHEGNLWLGSDANGLARLRNGWTQRFSTPEGLHDPTVWSIMPDADGAIWVGTTQGLSRFADGRFELIVPGQALPHPAVYTLLAEEDRVWLGTRGGGLALYRDGEVSIPPGTAALADAQISSIVGDGAGGVWLATSKGLCRYRQSELRCHGREAGLREARTRFVHPTRDGRLVVGSQGGLFTFDGERFHPLAEDVIPGDEDITAVGEFADGTLLVGTLSEDLYLETESGWRRFTQQDGLPINSPFFAALDESGHLWVSGLQGLYRVPYGDFEALAAGRIDRLGARMLLNERGDVRGAQQTFCCNGAGRAKGFMRDGVMWLPTRDGIIAVDTAEVRSNPHPPNVVVERVRIGGAWRDPAEGGVTLTPESRDLAVRFTALSFEAPESVLFRYRLRGFDPGWQTPDDITRRIAYYTNLPPGDYVFEVTAANNAEVWQPRVATLGVSVQPRFFETTAFYVLCVAVLGALFGAGYRLLLNRQRRQGERLAALVEARTEELRVANEHLREYSRRLEEASRTDPLTGLWNRRYLEGQLPADLSVLKRRLDKDPDCGLVTVFAVLDLDRFKTLNDRYGHGAGDQVLREFGALVSTLVRAGDYVVRWGGEEFVLVLREMAPADAEEALKRILNAVAVHPFRVFGDGSAPLHVTCSIGYAFCPFRPGGGSLTWEQIIEVADRALYFAKEAGRARCVGLHATELAAPGRSVSDIRSDTEAMLAAGELRRTEFLVDGTATAGESAEPAT